MNGPTVFDDHVHGTAPENGTGRLGRATKGLGGEERSQPTGRLRSVKNKCVCIVVCFCDLALPTALLLFTFCQVRFFFFGDVGGGIVFRSTK